VGASGCAIVDTNGDGTRDTAKIFGAVLFTSTKKGLENPTKLADITFHVVGGPETCTDFRLKIDIHADADANETGALVQDGLGCVAGTRTPVPPGGTEQPTVASPRTSEPTPEGGVTFPPASQPGGQTNPPGGSGATPPGGGSGSVTAGGRTPANGTPAGTGNGGVVNPPGDEDGGGVSGIVWVILGVGVLAVAGGGAWALARSRRPSEGP
jgi:hypothetical protein